MHTVKYLIIKQTIFFDHKAHLNSFKLYQKSKGAPYNAVRLMYEFGCAFLPGLILCGKLCYLFNC